MSKRASRNIPDILKNFVKYRDLYNSTGKYKKEFEYYREKCVSHFDFIVKYRVNKYKSFDNYEDLEQEGRIALINALKSYNPKMGGFSWWANKYVKTKLSREANKHSSFRIPLKVAAIMPPKKVACLNNLIDNSPDSFDETEKNESNSIVRKAINSLPSKQRDIINFYFQINGIKSYSISRLAKVLNISTRDCTELLNEAKQNLKVILERQKEALNISAETENQY